MPPEPDLQEAIAHLAAIERGACSPGEREAAEWIAERLRAEGCEVAVEEEPSYASYAPAMSVLGAASIAAGVAALRGGRGARAVAAVVAAGAAAAIAEDAVNGPRLLRRLLMRKRPTTNVVARTGDPEGSETLVVLAHHDAHPTAFLFDQSGERAFAERFPELYARTGSVPFWWPVIGSPLLIALGALSGRRLLTRAGIGGSLVALAAALDLSRGRIVPGANDNLSAVAGLIGVAAALRERPVPGVRVLLVSCGAEETLQGGIYGFVESHAGELDPAHTSFLNFELLGASHHVLLEGEGPLWIEDYTGPELRDRIERAAASAGVPMRRGVRIHVSTDSVVPSRAGYAIATLITVDELGMIPNYHLMADTPENIAPGGIEGGVAIAIALAAELSPWPPPRSPA